MLKQTDFWPGQGQDDPEIRRQIVEINQHRLTWILSILVFVHIAHIAVFWPYIPNVAAETEQWGNEVILVHSALLAFIAVALPGKFLLERYAGKARAIQYWIPEVIGLVYLLSGVALAIVDQRVTPSINALMIATNGVGLVIVTRPVIGLFQYLFTLGVFLVGVSWVQKDPNLLLTVRVNSITAIGLGFGLTLIQWRNGTLSLLQQRRIKEQQTELEEKNRELTILATQDALTGLMNRTEFSREVNKAIDSMQGAGMPTCLIMVDLDDFKAINDTHGHPVGDRILIELAGIMTRSLRTTDIVGRFGGEEFVILLPGHSVEAGVQVAERLRSAISGRPIDLGGQLINVTASFGVAGLDAGLSDALSQSYSAADQALYQAKNDGRNCVRYKDRLRSG